MVRLLTSFNVENIMFNSKVVVIAVVFLVAVVGFNRLIQQDSFVETNVEEPEQTSNVESATQAPINDMPIIDNKNNTNASIKDLSVNNDNISNQENAMSSSIEKPAEQYANNGVDEIGGYIDESAIAPEDEVPQNNFIDSIGYEDPTAEDPASEPLDTPADDGMSDVSDHMMY